MRRPTKLVLIALWFVWAIPWLCLAFLLVKLSFAVAFIAWGKEGMRRVWIHLDRY